MFLREQRKPLKLVISLTKCGEATVSVMRITASGAALNYDSFPSEPIRALMEGRHADQ